jgi:hypothetical protein
MSLPSTKQAEFQYRDLLIRVSERDILMTRDREFLIKIVGNAIRTEITRPFREVLGMGGKAKE